jgi:hypothetical protein
MMSPRTLLFLIVGFFGGLGLFSACSTANQCSSANCAGCCDAMGKCQLGTTADTCGLAGASCGRCGTGTVCQSGECRASSGNGGGTGGNSGTGGGTAGTGGGNAGTGGGNVATGGGSAGGCRQVPAATTNDGNLVLAEYRTFSNSPGHYNFAQWFYPTSQTAFDAFRLEVVYPNDVGPTPPLTQPFTAVGYFSCSVCSIFYENCDPMTLECTKSYLAQSGSVTISRADRAVAGRMTGSASNVHFREWNLMTDQAVPNGGCVDVATIGPWNVGWSNDGGVIPP